MEENCSRISTETSQMIRHVKSGYCIFYQVKIQWQITLQIFIVKLACECPDIIADSSKIILIHADPHEIFILCSSFATFYLTSSTFYCTHSCRKIRLSGKNYLASGLNAILYALSYLYTFNPLSANFIKWSNTLKQFVGKLPTNCLSVFDYFVGLALKGSR